MESTNFWRYDPSEPILDVMDSDPYKPVAFYEAV